LEYSVQKNQYDAGKKISTKTSNEAGVSRSSCELMYIVSNSGRVMPMPKRCWKKLGYLLGGDW